jgi:hypothetical protein
MRECALMPRGISFGMAALACAGLLAYGGTASSSTHRSELKISPIQAVFVDSERATHYTVPQITAAVGAVTFSWTLTLKPVDPSKGVDTGCNNHGTLTASTPEFVWHHGDKTDPVHNDGCEHALQGIYGHQGLITVVVTDASGARCTATYKGTNTSDANSVANGIASTPVCKAAPTSGGSTTTPFPVTSGKVTGTVLIRLPGTTKFVPLKPGTRIPNGSLIDATHGTVVLPGPGGSDVFYAGQFIVFSTTELAPRRAAGVQTVRRQVVELRLAGGDFRICRTTAAAGKTPPKKPVRSLWGKGTGRFRTKGKYAAATVRGTFWLTQDRCDGTYVLVKQGKVEVRDFVKRKTVLLTPGKSYLAARGR